MLMPKLCDVNLMHTKVQSF